MIPLIVIAGPTASGKTALGIEIAKKIGGEIISADSMQIYKEMNIGTAKPDKHEMQGVPHHLIDFLDIGEDFSVNDFAAKAHEIIKQIYERGKMPIIVGGTGLYIDVVVNNIELSKESFSREVRDKLERMLEKQGNRAMYDLLHSIDEVAASKLHVNDTKRVIRALEIFYNTGKTKTETDVLSRKAEKRYNTLYFAINLDRKLLYDRINYRVDKMMEAGLLEEVLKLYKNDKFLHSTANQAIGYKEIIGYLEGRYQLDEAIEVLKKDTRHLAKRQLTWFNKNKNIIWLDGSVPFSTMLEECLLKIQEGLK